MEDNKIVFFAKPNLSMTSKQKYPCFVLTTGDRWDDFGYKTLFRLYFFRSKSNYDSIGEVKILQIGKTKTTLPKSFSYLDENMFCSLGQSVDYYNSVKNLDKSVQKAILSQLNDAAYNSGLRSMFEDQEGFSTSLIRYSEASKALREGKKIIENAPVKNTFNFAFSCRLTNVKKAHRVKFHFDKKIDGLNRIIALVGRNGTGKTQILAKLANSLSGKKKEGKLSFRPPFSKVIAVSYSLFDKFDIPLETKTFSYVYCGLRDKSGKISESQLLKKLQRACNQISKKGRQQLYYELLKNIIDEDIVNLLLDEDGDFRNDFVNNIDQKKITLSSGQSIYVYILSEILANIREESLLLFDEPETHLHPNAIAKIINALYRILNKFDSYAIIATHSPIIIQQIPSRFVQVFEKEGKIPIVRTLGLESFGENLSNITNDIFETVNVEESYKVNLKKLAGKYKYETILEMFNNKLNFNAKIYLRNLYKK